MPFRNVWAVRVKSPGDFKKGTITTKRISNGVSILVGKLKSAPTGGMVVQAYRFNIRRFRLRNQVINWLTKHKAKYMSIEKPIKADEHLAVQRFRQVLDEVAERRQ